MVKLTYIFSFSIVRKYTYYKQESGNAVSPKLQISVWTPAICRKTPAGIHPWYLNGLDSVCISNIMIDEMTNLLIKSIQFTEISGTYL